MADYSNGSGDILRIDADLIPPIDPVLDELLERGKKERVLILAGTEFPGPQRKPYARTDVTIKFPDEHNLRECVRLLRWSDERLRARLDQLMLWEWEDTYRQDMTIHFGVRWFTRAMFEARKDAFKDTRHESYYAAFGAKASDFKTKHEILQK